MKILKPELPQAVYEQLRITAPDRKEVGIPWISFLHGGKNFSVFLATVQDQNVVSPLSQQLPTGKVVEIGVHFSTGEKYGRIFGLLKKMGDVEGFELSSPGLYNDYLEERIGRPPIKLAGHVSGVIRETIKQLILRGGISRWVSSETLLDGGVMLYESLARDSSLLVQKHHVGVRNDGADRYQYTVMKMGE